MSQRTDGLVAEARRYLGVMEAPKNSNRGRDIDYWIHEVGLEPAGAYPWCAAFVSQVGRQAEGHRWPCPRTAGVAILAAWAATKANVLQTTPAVGDLFLLWSPTLKRFAHVGIVTLVNGGQYETIEGNTNVSGGREGFGVFARMRSTDGASRFIRWENA